MTKLEFYRGRIDSYDQSKHGHGIYFSTDTFEIIHNSQSFAFTPSKKFVEELLDGTIGDIEEYGIAFRKEEADLRDEVDKIIDKLYSEGKIDALLAKYFGDANGFKRN